MYYVTKVISFQDDFIKHAQLSSWRSSAWRITSLMGWASETSLILTRAESEAKMNLGGFTGLSGIEVDAGDVQFRVCYHPDFNSFIIDEAPW